MPHNISGLKRGGPGRPKGVPNKVTAEARAACAELVDDPVYRERLKARLLAGRLPPALECLLWHYAKGKPKDDLQVTGNERGPLEIIVRKPSGSQEGSKR